MSTYPPPPPPPIPASPPPPPFSLPPTRPPNWFQRNWKWFVPVTVVAGIVLLVAVVALAVLGGLKAMKGSDAYQLSLTTAQKSPQAIQRLGDPIQDKVFFSGNINLTNGAGQAHFEIPIKGPNGEATIISNAAKDSGPWELTSIVLRFPDGGTMDLLDNPEP